MKKLTPALVFATIALCLTLCVAWNIVAPSHLCWLGFWKGTGTLFIAMIFAVMAGAMLEN